MTTSSLSPLRLPVHTASGQSLGAVVDVVIDPATQGIIQYYVKPNRLVPDAVWAPLVIHQSQVVSISPAGMVVDDAALPQRGGMFAQSGT